MLELHAACVLHCEITYSCLTSATLERREVGWSSRIFRRPRRRPWSRRRHYVDLPLQQLETLLVLLF